MIKNLRSVKAIDFMLVQCREDPSMTYEECAAYLRRNSVWIDQANEANKSTRIMHARETPVQETPHTKNYDEVCVMFTTMEQEEGLFNAYRAFNTRVIRQNLNIPDQIWNELEPQIKQRITEIRSKLRKQKPDSGVP